jgi:hypothetical protein
VLVSSVAILLPDIAPESGMLAVSLAQGGSEVQRGSAWLDGRRGSITLPFVHQRRQVPFTIDYANPGTRRGGRIGDDDFVGLNPFAAWTLDFAFDGNDWLELAGLRRVRLVFEGSYYGPSDPARPVTARAG